MKIDMVASETHYQDHMLPIFEALPDHLRGNVLPLARPGEATRPPMGRIAMVAGWQDVSPLRGQCPMIYVEHGAGQTYSDRPFDPSYSASGGQRHQGVVGFISPNEEVASRWTTAPSIAVGCPKMDQWVQRPYKQPGDSPAICFAFHWDCRLSPESRSAWEWYAPHMVDIVAWYRSVGFRVFVHEHPKWRGELIRQWAELLPDVPVLYTDREVFEQADILMMDNSSLMYEFALISRPVVALNAPWYRRDVEHGLRFWRWVPGIEVNDHRDLLALNPWDLIHETPLRGVAQVLGSAARARVYAWGDGSSSARAAQFIVDLLSEV